MQMFAAVSASLADAASTAAAWSKSLPGVAEQARAAVDHYNIAETKTALPRQRFRQVCVVPAAAFSSPLPDVYFGAAEAAASYLGHLTVQQPNPQRWPPRKIAKQMCARHCQGLPRVVLAQCAGPASPGDSLNAERSAPPAC
jgi:hypothetical protein